jgi:hypothetical protein
LNIKKSCSLWLAIYVVVAIAVGALVYRRFPLAGAAIGGGVFGGGIVWLGLAYLAGVRTKIAEALRLRGAVEGSPPEDGETIAVVGTIEAVASPLTSPLSGAACVAYKYEVRNGDTTVYDGFALAPSAIFSMHGQIRILAYPDLQVPERVVPSAEALPRFSEYVEKTEFREPSLGDIRAIFDEAMKGFDDAEGSVRSDTRNARGDVPLHRATFVERIVTPGQRVFATGHYSLARGGLVRDPDSPLSLIISDAAQGGTAARSVRGAIGSLIGAAIFLGIAAAGLAGLYAFVPLAASEQMSPRLNPTWREVRMERLLERRVRGRMRKAGLLDSGTVTAVVPAGTARGRVAAHGHDVTVSRATAVRLGDLTIVRIDDDAVALTLGPGDRPLRLRFGNDDVDASTFARDLEVDITENSGRDVAGRVTYFRDDAPAPACRVTFHATVQ